MNARGEFLSKWKWRVAGGVAVVLAALRVPAADPAGAVEFSVAAPTPRGGVVVRAADFGVSVSSADNTPALQAAIDRCRETGAARLVMEKGRYRFTSDGPVTFCGVSDLTFDGGGAVFEFFHRKGPNVTFERCVRMVFRNVAIDWDWSRDPLGSVVEIQAKDERSVTFRFIDYEDFPRKDVRCAYMSPWDPETREVGFPDMDNGFSIDMSWGGPMPHPPREWLAGNVLRVDTPVSHDYVKPGALFRMAHYYYDMHGFVIANTSDFLMEDVEVMSNPGHAFIVDGTTHHCHFRNVNIRIPKDDPRRAITCTADHFHVNRSKGFIKFENCEFSLGNDDCMNLHDSSLHAPIRLNDHTLRVRLRSRAPFGEDDLVELRHGNFKPTGIVCKVKTRRNAEGGYDITFPVKLPESEWEGFVMFDRTSSTRNVILRNCWFHGNRSRGLILAAPDVTVEDSRFSHTEGPAMIFTTGWTYKLWCEGSGVSNVVVRNCRFERVNVAHRKRNGAVADVVMDAYARWPGHAPVNGWPVVTDVLFDGNVFVDPSGYVANVREGAGIVFRNTTVELRNADPFAPSYRGAFAGKDGCLGEVGTRRTGHHIEEGSAPANR